MDQWKIYEKDKHLSFFRSIILKPDTERSTMFYIILYLAFYLYIILHHITSHYIIYYVLILLLQFYYVYTVMIHLFYDGFERDSSCLFYNHETHIHTQG